MHIHGILTWHWIMWIYIIIFWFLMFLGIAVIIKWSNSQTSSKESSLEVFENRYGKCEISEKDFRKIKKKNERSKRL